MDWDVKTLDEHIDGVRTQFLKELDQDEVEASTDVIRLAQSANKPKAQAVTGGKGKKSKH